MAIVKHKTASGIIYCYDSTPKWDPNLKQARPQKTYLGRWDEATQSIIPTTGRRGRKKKDESSANVKSSPADSDRLVREYINKVAGLEQELAEAKKRIEQLSRENITTRLSEHHVEQQVIDRFIEAIDECEFVRYAPGDATGNMNKVYEKAITAIEQIEKSKKGKK